jgi:hypothetical protein
MHFDIPTRSLTKPVDIRNVDGIVNKKGTINQVADLILQFKRKTHIQTFYVADLENDHMILGMPFLATANPIIDWKEASFIGKVEAATTDAHHKPLPPRTIDAPTLHANQSFPSGKTQRKTLTLV